MVKILNIPDYKSLIVDLGCGSGKLLNLLAHCGYKNLFGVDIQELSTVERGDLGYTFIHCDLLKYLKGAENSTVDCIILTDVLEHLDLDSASLLLSEIYRVLVKGGIFLIRVPNMSSPFGIQIGYGDLTHKINYTRSSLTQLLLLSNFENIKFVKEPLSNYPPQRFLARVILKPLFLVYSLMLYSYGANDRTLDQNLLCRIKK